MWNKCLSKIHSCSINSRHQLIQFKITHQLHYSKVRLHKIYPFASPMCDRCNVSEGTLPHALWSCLSLTGLWSNVFDWFSKAYKTPLQPEHGLWIFGCSKTPGTLWQPLELGLIVAKRLILGDWKSSGPLSYHLWVTDMMFIIQMERLHKGSKDTFPCHWSP